jgi:CubicO group peptidase (beta-lactamase class C family)
MLNVYELEKQVEMLMADRCVPGLAVAVVHGCQIIYARGFGVTNAEERGVDVTPSTLFRVGSVTKPLTGTVAMRLMEEGKLLLDAPVATYVPEFGAPYSGELARVTVRMLMNHTSGLPSEATDHGASDASALARHARFAVPNYPVLFPPGRFWSYSNLGIDVLGHIIASLAGKSFAEAMEESLFAPVGMCRTTFDPKVAMTYPLALSHDRDDSGNLKVRHRFVDNAAEHPDGFAVSTVLDLANFAILHLQGGRFREVMLLRPESIAQMHKGSIDLYLANYTEYGLTFFTGLHKGLRRVWHDGAIDRYGSRLMMIPDRGIAVVVSWSRANDFWDAINGIVDHVCDQLLEPQGASVDEGFVQPDPGSWDACLGNFRGQSCGACTLQSVGDRLVLSWGQRTVPLRLARHDVYVGENEHSWISVGVIREGIYPVQFIVLNGEPCERIGGDLSDADPATWSSFAGVYMNEQGGRQERLQVDVRNGRLWIISDGSNGSLPCIPWGARSFRSRLGGLTFDPPIDGVSRIFNVGSERVFQRLGSPTP